MKHRYYWIDWGMVILWGLFGVLCLTLVAMIVLLVLVACGVIPVEPADGTNTLPMWISIYNTLRIVNTAR